MAEQDPLQSGKRRRGNSNIDLRLDPNNVLENGLSTDERTTKRARSAVEEDLASPIESPPYLVVHMVKCDAEGNHRDHDPEAMYLDIPRLLGGDSKASVLRGQIPIDEDELHPDMLEERGVNFVVYKNYDCRAYHETVKDDFIPLPLPQIKREVLSGLKAHFFSLPEDGEEAVPNWEYIDKLSTSLKKSLEIVGKINRSRLQHLSFEAPYTGFYHARSLLEDHATGRSGVLSDLHQDNMTSLLDYVLKTCADDYEAADALFAQGLVERRHFLKLFPPDEVVVDPQSTQPVAYVTSSCVQNHDFELSITCWNWQYDGIFRRKGTTRKITWPSYDDQIPISRLPLYPLRFDTSGLEQRLRKRGELFWDCRKRKFVSYESSSSPLELQTGNPRYMIDIATYKQLHPDAPQAPQNDETDLDASDLETPPEDPFILLLPATIRGYGFHDKKWNMLSLEHIREVVWSSDAFERRLVLKGPKKELIKALITVHIAVNNSYRSDIIEGKGKGLIIMLHGGPGTGKTLTAESVAELAEKPLYRVTCGDIGTDPEGVEKYLESVLYIGTIWGCVVLLDEADVFLEERVPTDLQRNALVSVFLRVLEYYDGILILTSNRVGTFDEAFKSRVQLAMHYPPLDKEGRWQIWNDFLKSMVRDKENVDDDEMKDKLDVLARSELNGRQIRNTVNTARQLALYKKERLAYKHFEQAIDVTNEFEEYINKAQGHKDEEYARMQGHRY